MYLSGVLERRSTSALAEVQMGEAFLPISEIQTSPQLEFPILNLLSEKHRDKYFQYGVPFYHAAITGDTDTGRGIREQFPEIVRARITRGWETGLHIAAAAKSLSFVSMLVKLMTPDEIALTNDSFDTALCFAAASGIVDIAKEMVKKNQNLPLIRGKGGMTPLHMAAELGHRDMVNYLLPLTEGDEFSAEDLVEFFISLINTNLYDIALLMLERYPTLSWARDKSKETALHVLARKCLSSIFHQDTGLRKGLISSGFSGFFSNNSAKNTQALNLVSELWKKVVQVLDGGKISELIRQPTHLLFVATASGNVEFIKILLKFYPDLIWEVDLKRRSMFHSAVHHRQEGIFRIIYEIGAMRDLIARRDDSKGNNMLHLAAKLAPPNRLNVVSGAALQLQRELMWFKEVEKIVQPSYTEMKNDDEVTPKELFVARHKELREEGEKWMKSTAQSCMLVAALIATVMFAAAFNLPGGIMDNGTPNYLKKRSFLIFVTSDSLSLFLSTASILMFLSILTARYKEEDFLHNLPTTLIVGLSTLFLSMVTMMIAFTASMFIVFPEESHRPAIPISYMACIPVALYALLHYNLFADIFSSTYNSKIIFQSHEKSLLGPDFVADRSIFRHLVMGGRDPHHLDAEV